MRRCLIVDDSNSIRKVARRILEDLDFQTIEVATSLDALRVCGTDMPDCIVVDWNLPDLDGAGFLARLRRMPDGGRAAVLLSTVENDPARLAKARRMGADGCVLKPFDREAMTRCLATLGLV